MASSLASVGASVGSSGSLYGQVRMGGGLAPVCFLIISRLAPYGAALLILLSFEQSGCHMLIRADLPQCSLG